MYRMSLSTLFTRMSLHLWEMIENCNSLINIKIIFLYHVLFLRNIWDLRHPRFQLSSIGHNSDVTCVSYNPFNEFILATASADKTVAVWDVRNMGKRMYTLRHHTDEIFQVAFSPHIETVLASSGSDELVVASRVPIITVWISSLVIVWDLSKVEDPSNDPATQPTAPPPEVVFVHSGHLGKVADFSWNPNRPWTICSTDEYNKFQVSCSSFQYNL